MDPKVLLNTGHSEVEDNDVNGEHLSFRACDVPNASGIKWKQEAVVLKYTLVFCSCYSGGRTLIRTTS